MWVNLRAQETKDGSVTFTVEPSKATTYRADFSVGTAKHTVATSDTVIVG